MGGQRTHASHHTMAEFAVADVPDEGKGPAAASAGGGGAEDSYPLTVVYCGGESQPSLLVRWYVLVTLSLPTPIKPF